jgi:hypothetical protein
MLETAQHGEPSTTGQAIVCIADGVIFVMLGVLNNQPCSSEV